MVNPQRGEARVTLGDGKEHVLRYDFNAIASIEEATGRSITGFLAALKGDVPYRDIRALVWAGLLHTVPLHHRNRILTLEDVGRLLPTDPSVGEVAASAALALARSLGVDVKEGGGGQGEAKGPGPGPGPTS